MNTWRFAKQKGKSNNLLPKKNKTLLFIEDAPREDNALARQRRDDSILKSALGKSKTGGNERKKPLQNIASFFHFLNRPKCS
ncbi:hypothetical protein [Prochlorococcus marinus]|uniref:hypothetical protein n=1 Tax=Prochlorococcus marinus TaxID=1219 RepID=UPI0022B570FB|nr:hypothetical protein [Prochlorococcus marinus]